MILPIPNNIHLKEYASFQEWLMQDVYHSVERHIFHEYYEYFYNDAYAL